MKRDTRTLTFWTSAEPPPMLPRGQLDLPLVQAPRADPRGPNVAGSSRLPLCDRCLHVEAVRPSGLIPREGRNPVSRVVAERCGLDFHAVCDGCFAVLWSAYGDRR